MQRRAFIRQCGLFCAGGILLSGLADGCTPVYYAASQLEENKISVKRSEFTDPKGKQRPFVVIRNEKLGFPVCVYYFGGNDFIALSTECTHSSCEVQPNKTSLVCPCHGSEFSNRGKVLNPPAEKDLRNYFVSTDHENIYVHL